MQLSLDAAMERTFTVAEFGLLLTDLLASTFPHDVWIQGEVRDLVRAQSGHVYFTLVDPAPEPGRRPDAALPVVLFEGTKRVVNAQIKRSGGGMRIDDGVAVRIRGVPDFYAPQGKLSLRMTAIDPTYTIGRLAASRERLLAALAEEGALGRNGALPFPAAPMRIGLVTAAGSAAHADFLDELGRTSFGFRVVFTPTAVQGAGAAAQIAAGIRTCEAHGAEVIAVVRGGGARTDLVAFDDEVVARTIAHCQVPVLTGIGHEIDTAVADEVAHLALKTPTACAAHLVEAVTAADRRLEQLWAEATTAAHRKLTDHDQRITTAAQATRRSVTGALREADARTIASGHRVRDLTNAQLERARQRLSRHAEAARLNSRHRLSGADMGIERSSARLARLTRQRLHDAERRLHTAEVQTRLLDPAHTLARGWSITTDAAGRVVRSVTEAPPGSRIVTRLADGRIASVVGEAIEQEETS